MAGTSMDIHEHGVFVDKKKRRVKCNYCGKEMNTFTRLKYHLGSVGPDVTPCEHVAFTVREAFRNMLLKDKPGLTAAKGVGEFQIGNCHHKRGSKNKDLSSKTVSPEKMNTFVEASKQDLSSNKTQNSIGGFFYENYVDFSAVEEANQQGLLSNKAQKRISRFFYENCIDFSAVDSPSFKELLLETTVGGGKLPDSHELNGRMLQEALNEVKDHVKKIKDSWEITGCSILLDAWVDQKGRDLVSFIADCPAGPVYLRSFDVSDIKNDITALTSLLDGLIEDVGVRNVIQIIACLTYGWVGELGKCFVDNNNKVFWSVSISHCLELMLVKIGETDNFREVLDKVSKIWEFIKTKGLVLKLFKDHSHGKDMTVSCSEDEFVTPYLILESILKAKSDLEAMFALSDWNKEEDTTISKWVKDSSFWESVERLVKCTSPLICGLLRVTTANNQHVGYIYDTMDVIKESIAMEFNKEEIYYKPLWDLIDDVWNEHLHSPLHAAGYFLNPAYYYSTDFHLDPEVATGLISSLVRLVKECNVQAKISTQLEKYRLGKDCFNEANDQISAVSPAEWWAQKASQQPELQSFAIKILSQTCEGASSYKLKRRLAEKLLLTEGMSRCEQKHLEDLAYVHYNLHLQSCKAKFREETLLQDVYIHQTSSFESVPVNEWGR